MKKTEKILPIIFAIAGSLMLLGAIWLTQHTRSFVAHSAEVPGTVIELIQQRSDKGYTYAPVVMFTTHDGDEVVVQSNTSSNPPAYSVGESVTVLYLPEAPQNAKIRSFLTLWFAPIITFAFAVLFSAIGFGIIVYQQQKTQMIKRLTQQGITVQADIIDISLDRSYTVNNQNPYRIYAQYSGPEGPKTFRSDAIWFDPTAYAPAGKKVTVYVDLPSMKKYHVDLSFLPSESTIPS